MRGPVGEGRQQTKLGRCFVCMLCGWGDLYESVGKGVQVGRSMPSVHVCGVWGFTSLQAQKKGLGQTDKKI